MSEEGYWEEEENGRREGWERRGREDRSDGNEKKGRERERRRMVGKVRGEEEKNRGEQKIDLKRREGKIEEEKSIV